jgi:hypothetical protein
MSRKEPSAAPKRRYGIRNQFEGLDLGSFTGDAVYLGPTFFWKVGPKTLVSASWEAQVAGREISGLSPLDLADFSRQRARLLLEFEF